MAQKEIHITIKVGQNNSEGQKLSVNMTYEHTASAILSSIFGV
jgi:hypothetical protein